MRIVVVGATGYVGSAVVEEISRHGHRPVLVARHTPHSPFEAYGGDVLTMPLEGPLAGADAVVNLIGIIRERPAHGMTFEALHVEWVERLLANMRSAGVDRLVHVSALGTRQNARSRYHQTKWQAEERIRRDDGVAATILRPSLIFGGGAPFFAMLAQIAGTPFGALIPGDGGARFDPVYRGDVARMIYAALTDPEQTAGELFEMGGPERFTLDQLVSYVARVRGLGPVAHRHLPVGLLSSLARLGERLPAFPVTVDQLMMLDESNITDDTRWHQWVVPTPIGSDL